jgi:hypothetical protein
MQVLLGRSGTQEGVELSPQPLAIKIEMLAALGGAILQGAQPQPLERLNDGVEVGGARGSDRNGNQLQPSLHGMMKSRLPKRMSAPGAHLPAWLAIRSLVESTRRAKGPHLACQLSVFQTAD